MSKTFSKILVANRGEIASRIIRSLKEAGKKTVAIYSEADRNLAYVIEADEAWPLGDGQLSDTYLNADKIIQISRSCSADAIHPGYGFLSENDKFAAQCEENNISIIGPDSSHIQQMGNKANARKLAQQFGVPVLQSYQGTASELLKIIPENEYPFLIKPSAGGGGKGMKLVEEPSSLEEALNDAEREALNYFGSPELYIEKYIPKARHIEVQVLGDAHGNYVHLFERECSIQRRHQKVIEEAPSASISDKTRNKLGESALALIRGIGYKNAGTLEFLMDENNTFYFIEMNTRIQVEHPVSEAITGIDIVREQLRIAEGKPLCFSQDEIQINGHAIEARIYAEDPDNSFLPSSGIIRSMQTDLVLSRIDSTYVSGNTISPYYDPMIAKVIAHGSNRDDAARKLSKDLENFHLSGIKTNRYYLQQLLRSTDFLSNNLHTTFLDNYSSKLATKQQNNLEDDLLTSIMTVISLLNVPMKDNSPWTELGYWRQTGRIGIIYAQKKINSHILSTTEDQFRISTSASKEYDIQIIQKHENLLVLKAGNQTYQIFYHLDLPEIFMQIHGKEYHAIRSDILSLSTNYAQGKVEQEHPGQILSPIQGKVVKVDSERSKKVKKGDVLAIIESMKMENKILAPKDAEIEKIHIQTGDQVSTGELIIELKEI